MGLNFYHYDGLQPEMSAGIINEHECTTKIVNAMYVSMNCNKYHGTYLKKKPEGRMSSTEKAIQPPKGPKYIRTLFMEAPKVSVPISRDVGTIKICEA